VAKKMNVPFIDLQYLTEQTELLYGIEGSKKLHLQFDKGENDFFPDGKTDDTHLSKLGANEVVKLVINEICVKIPEFKKYFILQ